MQSAIYHGSVVHRRTTPKLNQFQYQVSMLYLDLAEVDALLDSAWGWSNKGPALGRLRRGDFIGPDNLTIEQAVRQRVREETGRSFSGSIRMLANLRYFGYIINPLVCYYCFDADESLQYIVAEVTNTPWRERHSYVLPCDPRSRIQRIRFNKAMHVSPFNSMDVEYQWRSSFPGENINIHLVNWEQEERQFSAGLVLKREALSRFSLEKLLLRHPFMTAKVAAAIYWQALRLYLKGVPFVVHPNSRATTSSD